MKRYKVTLEAEERQHLQELIAAGKAAARKLAHARILLKADAAEGGPAWLDGRIAEALEVSTDTVERVRRSYEYRQRRFASRFDEEADSDGYEERSEAYQRLIREVIDAQRVTLQALRDAGKINDEVMRRIERELDLEDSRLEI